MKKLPASGSEIRRAAIAALETEGADSALLSIAFVGTRAITSLNTKYLRKRRPTDVIAFAFQNPSGGSATVGDIYICPEVARGHARRQGVPVKQELLRLVVHGVLHTLGHDHPDSESRVNSAMWRRQEEILASLR
ncbi:MAG: rRNA maturation RNase YbeY [Gemmatimonadaceae bacterium]|nr:rRNA maturation RNase YbeY [Gemmatimonadaceae bacterium]